MSDCMQKIKRKNEKGFNLVPVNSFPGTNSGTFGLRLSIFELLSRYFLGSGGGGTAYNTSVFSAFGS